MLSGQFSKIMSHISFLFYSLHYQVLHIVMRIYYLCEKYFVSHIPLSIISFSEQLNCGWLRNQKKLSMHKNGGYVRSIDVIVHNSHKELPTYIGLEAYEYVYLRT